MSTKLVEYLFCYNITFGEAKIGGLHYLPLRVTILSQFSSLVELQHSNCAILGHNYLVKPFISSLSKYFISVACLSHYSLTDINYYYNATKNHSHYDTLYIVGVLAKK